VEIVTILQAREYAAPFACAQPLTLIQALNLALWIAQVTLHHRKRVRLFIVDASLQDLLRFMNVWVQFVAMVAFCASALLFPAFDWNFFV
jgi:hypothetical protein